MNVPVRADELDCDRHLPDLTEHDREVPASDVPRNRIWSPARKWISPAVSWLINGALVAVSFAAGFVDHHSRGAAALGDRQTQQALLSPTLIVKTGTNGRNAAYCVCSVPLGKDEVPASVRDALLATEDRSFFSHGGIDPVGIARALLAQLRGRDEGGSTITQQLVKNAITGDEHTIERKLIEARIGLRVERLFTKDEILRLYLGRSNFGRVRGREVWGLRNAAHAYWGKPPEQLDAFEAALLVGLLQAPSAYNPFRHAARALRRTRTVLDRMISMGVLSPAERRTLQDRRMPREPGVWPDERARYFVAHALTELDNIAELPSTAGQVRVVLTLDPRMQALAEYTVEQEPRHTPGTGAARAGLLSLDDDGAIRAMLGGDDFKESQFNLTTQAWRQPASTAKLATFAAALENGWTAQSVLEDSPGRFTGVAPGNADGRYLGRITLGEALILSRNTATWQLARQVGLERVKEMAVRLGLYPSEVEAGAVVLGAAEARLIDITAAYLPIANWGWRVEPHSIQTVLGRNGRVLWQHESSPRRVLSDRVVRPLRRLLHRAVAEGTGRQAALDVRVYGKTGTSSHHRDAWFVGFDEVTGSTTGVWVGPEDGEVMQEVWGGTLPARIWRRYTANNFAAVRSLPTAPRWSPLPSGRPE